MELVVWTVKPSFCKQQWSFPNCRVNARCTMSPVGTVRRICLLATITVQQHQMSPDVNAVSRLTGQQTISGNCQRVFTWFQLLYDQLTRRLTGHISDVTCSVQCLFAVRCGKNWVV
jgi:hypothetical protein